ncbi:MAG TPA: IS110 family transposase, partial [Actinomycetota bacterium]
MGVDTHKDLHVARAKDELGRTLGEMTIPASATGYRALLSWSRGLGKVQAFGVEGTGCYGAGLARHLRREGEVVIEVIRPNRSARRLRGKSDPADADAAASAVLSGEANGTPKSGDGAVEMIRVLRVARTTAIRARTQAINALHALVVTAPRQLRERLQDLSGPHLVRTCATLRPGALAGPTEATKMALRSLARRCLALQEEVQALDQELERLAHKACPALLGIFGAGSDTAGALLLAAGDNPERLRSEAAFAKLCGVSPVEASSGKITRHRLNRGGDRHANAALHRIVMVRLRWRHQATTDYLARRMAEGKSKREIVRCLKRYVA